MPGQSDFDDTRDGSPVTAAGGESAAISADGGFVGFSSYATDIVPDVPDLAHP